MISNEALLEKLFEVKNTTYLTHNFHPYAAKFIPQLPKEMITRLSEENDTVYDPFCGCGTTLVEAKLLNRKSIGVDSNPIAVLTTKVKTTKLSQTELQQVLNVLNKAKKRVYNLYSTDKNRLSFYFEDNHHKKDKEINLPEFHNRDHWFQKNVISEIAIIKEEIEGLDSEKLKNFLLLGLSSIIVQVSNQESETRYASKNKNIQNIQTYNTFRSKIKVMDARIRKFAVVASNQEANTYLSDARYTDFIDDNSVDLIVTSPPYPNTYDYYLYHKLRMYILGYDVVSVRENEIGSRNKHSSQKRDISDFVKDMIMCFKQFSRVLKANKFFVIVIGDSIIANQFIDAYDLTNEISKETSFECVQSLNYNLSKVSKTFNPSFRNTKKKEHIILLRNSK